MLSNGLICTLFYTITLQSMVNGLIGLHGRPAQLHAEVEGRQGLAHAPVLHLPMAEITVPDGPSPTRTATRITVQVRSLSLLKSS